MEHEPSNTNHISPPQEKTFLEEDSLTWDDAYPIALALRDQHPDIDLVDVSLGMILNWTIKLPNFIDDPALANQVILSSIYQEWFEEVNSL